MNITNVYQYDSRNIFKTVAPVNPNFLNRTVSNVSPVDFDLYNIQPYNDKDYVLNGTIPDNTNQLLYSGGNTQMITIPLQINDPYNENLRTQKVLITDYNKIKYGNC